MEKDLFKEYEEWCKKESKTLLSEESVKEFKDLKAKEEANKILASKNELRQVLVEKQKEILKLFEDYTGVNVQYNEKKIFDDFDFMIRWLIGLLVLNKLNNDCSRVFDKLLLN